MDKKIFDLQRSNAGPCVMLNVYDLDENWLVANEIFGNVLGLGGAFHVGVEIYGTEISFGCNGISFHMPRGDKSHIFRESIAMGNTNMSREAIERLVNQLAKSWIGDSYHLLARNCCSFARELCAHLVRTPMPGWIDRFARVASVYTGSLDIDDWFPVSSSQHPSLPVMHTPREVRTVSVMHTPREVRTASVMHTPREVQTMSFCAGGGSAQSMARAVSFAPELQRIRSASAASLNAELHGILRQPSAWSFP